LTSIVVSLALLLGIAVRADARQKTITLKKERTVRVVGVMRDLRPLGNKVLKLADTNPKQAINIIIDSPGGSVFGSMPLLQAVERAKSRGVVVNCVVTGKAMSMAMHLMAACSKNYILPSTLLMYHPVSVNLFDVRLTEDGAREIYTQMKIIGDYLDTKLRLRLGISEQLYLEFWRGEYIQFGHDFMKHAPKFATMVSDVRVK